MTYKLDWLLTSEQVWYFLNELIHKLQIGKNLEIKLIATPSASVWKVEVTTDHFTAEQLKNHAIIARVSS